MATKAENAANRANQQKLNEINRKDLEANVVTLEKEYNSLNNIFNSKLKLSKQDEIQKNNQEILNLLIQKRNDLLTSGVLLTEEEIKNENNIIDAQKKKIKDAENLNKIEKERLDITKQYLGVLGNQAKIGYRYLMDSDKIIKQTILSLGMSGVKAEGVRDSFEQSAGYSARLGGSLEEIGKIMTGYADETGRSRDMSGDMLKNIMQIAKGTGLSVEEAIKLGGQFDIMGINAKETNTFVQGIVDTSERMGINTTKVLKNINDNFKKINTYNFQTGTKGIAQMAMNAERLKVDMTSALNVAEMGRSLEKVIDLTANLQVLGGEFAKTDMFGMFYTMRNEPEKLTDKISEMTRGMVTFRKNSEGVMQTFISPADRDRLAAAGKLLGFTLEQMTEIAQRRAMIDKTARNLEGLGLTGREKQLIQGATFFNTENGKYEVKLAGKMQDITTLTKEQANSFVEQQVLLDKRAKDAITFEDALKATIASLKTALLPILRVFNWGLEKLSGLIDWLSKISSGGWGGVVSAITIFAGAAVAWKTIALLLNGASIRLATGIGGKLVGGGIGAATTLTTQSQILNPINNAGAGANAGKGVLRGGAGIGAAAIGIGAGIGAAAGGISLLADAMTKLDATKIAMLPDIIIALGGAMLFATIPLITLAGVAGMTFGPLAGLALVALGVGTAVGIAATGIGFMAQGLGELLKSSKDAGGALFDIGLGMATIGLSLAAFSNPLSMAGFGMFAATMGVISIASVAAAMTANSIEKMGTAMKGSKDDWIAVQNAITAISGANISGGGMLAELATLLKSPLKVEFANNEIQIKNNITLDIDKDVFMNKIIDVNAIVQKTVAIMKQGMKV